MKLDIYFQFRKKMNMNSEDYFQDVLKDVDHSYKFKTHEVKTIYMPIGPEQSNWVKENGIFTVLMENNLCCVIDEMRISFEEPGNDSLDVLNHLVSLFPTATAYEFSGSVGLNEPK